MNRRAKRILVDIGILLAAVFILLFYLMPYLWLLDASTMTYQDILAAVPPIIHSPYWGFYQGILTGQVVPGFRSEGYVNWLQTWANTVIISGVVGAIVTLFTLLAGYAFAKLDFPYKNGFQMFTLLSVLLPGATMILPVYYIIKALGLLNTIWGPIIFYPVLSLPLTIWMSISWFRSIPKEIEDSARIDGAGKLGVLRRIVLPLSKVTLATTFVFAFLLSWNQFAIALVILTQPPAYTVPVGLANYIIGYDVRWNEMAAAGITVSAPLVALFLLVQRYFIRGVMSGLVKG
jgi:ABC-type glycerol-3-phosphate transport system permease component